MTNLAHKEFKVNANLSYRWENDKVLFNTLIPLNKTAGEILDAIQDGNGHINDIISKLQEIYPTVPKEVLTNDINSMLDKLYRWNIIQNKSGEDKKRIMGINPNFTNILKKHFNNRLSAPARVSCKVTSVCNAKCLHCYAIDAEPGDELSKEEWLKFIDRLSELGVFSITFTGGDPLCRKDIVELVEHCTEKSIKTTIVTNGLALNKMLITQLKEAGIGGIFQSLDGGKAETHDNFRQVEGLFEKVIENIDLLLKYEINTVILCTLNKTNLNELDDMIDLVYSKGVKMISLMRYVDAGEGLRNNHLIPSPQDYMNLLTYLEEKTKQYDDLKLLFPDIPAKYYKETIGLEVYEQVKKEGLIGPCSAGISTIAIGATGGIKVCDVSTDKYLGNIREDDIQEIWLESSTLNRIRDLDKSKESPCTKCEELGDICWSGCKALDYQLEDEQDLFNSDMVCVQCYDNFYK